MKRITHTWLQKRGACDEQRLLFRELYPKGIEVCWMCFQEAQRKGLDVEWLADHLDASCWDDIDYLLKGNWKNFPKLAKKFQFLNWAIIQLPPEALKLLEKFILAGRLRKENP